MAENKKVSSVSFFNSRLTSVISISLVLFLLGLILLIGMLGNKLSVYVKENLSFSIVLKDNQKETEIKKHRGRYRISAAVIFLSFKMLFCILIYFFPID